MQTTQPTEYEVFIRAGSPLESVEEQVRSFPNSFLFVLDANSDSLLGIVSPEQVRGRLNAPNIVERERWRKMPIEALTSVPFPREERAAQAEQGSLKLEPKVIHANTLIDGGDDVAFLVGDDVYVNWRSVESALQHACIDPLTGLGNRLFFEKRVAEEWNQCERNSQSFGMMIVDVDDFKLFNDDLGHLAGDAVLRMVGQTIRESMRSYDIVARYGGDEFVGIVTGCQPEEIAIPMQRILARLQNAETSEDVPSVPKVSIGGAVIHFDDDSDTPSLAGVMHIADDCMYRSKRAGGGRGYFIDVGASNPDGIAHETSV